MYHMEIFIVVQCITDLLLLTDVFNYNNNNNINNNEQFKITIDKIILIILICYILPLNIIK